GSVVYSPPWLCLEGPYCSAPIWRCCASETMFSSLRPVTGLTAHPTTRQSATSDTRARFMSLALPLNHVRLHCKTPADESKPPRTPRSAFPANRPAHEDVRMTPALRQQLSKAMNRLATAFLPCLLALPCAAQQDLPQLFNSNDVSIPLDDADRHFIQHRIDQLQLAENCRRETVLEEPRADFRYLAAYGKEGPLRLYILPDVVRSRDAVLVLSEQDRRRC